MRLKYEKKKKIVEIKLRQTTEDGAFIFLLEAVYKFAGIFFILRFPLLAWFPMDKKYMLGNPSS